MERVQARIQEETALACEHPLDFKTLLRRMLTFRDERVVTCPACGQKVFSPTFVPRTATHPPTAHLLTVRSTPFSRLQRI